MTNQAPKTHPRPAQAFAEHAAAIHAITDAINGSEWLREDCRAANWGHVGNAGAARELLAQAAVMLGAMLPEEAKAEHGIDW